VTNVLRHPCLSAGGLLSSPLHAVIEPLGGPEADDGVDDGGGVHRRAAVDNGDDNGILLTVVTVSQRLKKRINIETAIGFSSLVLVMWWR